MFIGMPNRARGPYDAIVYIQDGEVIAEDATGAEIDSGTAGTDDFAVINSALALGGTVRLNAGTYRGNSNITIGANTNLIGDNRNTTTINFITANHHISMSGDYAQLRDLSFTGKGMVWITANFTRCENVTGHTIRHGLYVPNDYADEAVFTVFCAQNTTLQGHEFINCIAKNTSLSGFGNDRDWMAAESNEIITNQVYINCKAIDCGRYAQNRNPSWATGFCLVEGQTLVSNITLIGCHAEGCWESGFHAETAPAKANIKFVACTSNNNGQSTAPVYGSGFFVGDGCELVGCHASGNKKFGFWAYGSFTGEPISIDVVTENNIGGNYIYHAKNVKVSLFSRNDGHLQFGGNISNMDVKATIEEATSEALSRYFDATTDTVLNSKIDITDINSACANGYCVNVEKYKDCDVKIKLVRASATGPQYYVRVKDIARTNIILDAYAPDAIDGTMLLVGGSNSASVISGCINGCLIGVESWQSAGLSGDILFKNLIIRNCTYGFIARNNAAIVAGSIIIDKKSLVFDSVGTKITDAGHKIVYYSNSGSFNGTGSEQMIAHWLVSAPSKVAIVPTKTGTTVSAVWADTTNIYATVTTGKAVNWSAEV